MPRRNQKKPNYEEMSSNSQIQANGSSSVDLFGMSGILGSRETNGSSLFDNDTSRLQEKKVVIKNTKKRKPQSRQTSGVPLKSAKAKILESSESDVENYPDFSALGKVCLKVVEETSSLASAEDKHLLSISSFDASSKFSSLHTSKPSAVHRCPSPPAIKVTRKQECSTPAALALVQSRISCSPIVGDSEESLICSPSPQIDRAVSNVEGKMSRLTLFEESSEHEYGATPVSFRTRSRCGRSQFAALYSRAISVLSPDSQEPVENSSRALSVLSPDGQKPVSRALSVLSPDNQEASFSSQSIQNTHSTGKEDDDIVGSPLPIGRRAHSTFVLLPGKLGKRSRARLTRVSRVEWNQSRAANSFVLNSSYWDVYHKEDAKQTVLKIAKQVATVPFAKVFPLNMRTFLTKIGEGLFGEVFKGTRDDRLVVFKLLPVEGNNSINGEDQKSYDEILPELIASKELTALGVSETNRTQGFVELINIHVTQGSFPTYLNREWERFHTEKVSENENPKILPKTQQWLVFEYAFGGCPLEDFKIASAAQALSIFQQTALSLAVAEVSLGFEHRDLHVGNLLIGPSPTLPEDQLLGFCLEDGEKGVQRFGVARHGVQVVVIDFTLSRMHQGDDILFVDMGKDEEMFVGKGDYQFDIYRMMREANGGDWSAFSPITNVFWLHYLCTKLLDSTPAPDLEESGSEGTTYSTLSDLADNLLSANLYNSAKDIVLRHPLFQTCRL